MSAQEPGRTAEGSEPVTPDILGSDEGLSECRWCGQSVFLHDGVQWRHVDSLVAPCRPTMAEPRRASEKPAPHPHSCRCDACQHDAMTEQEMQQ